MNLKHSTLALLLFIMLTVTACTNGTLGTPSPELEIATPSDTSVETSTEKTNTPSPEVVPLSETPSAPLAVLVNGEGIPLDDYQAELARFQASAGTGLATYGEEVVLQDMVDQVLLSQAAHDSGFVVDNAMLEERIDQLGLSDQELEAWKSAYGYSEQGFLRAMRWSVASAWMRDQIIALVPETADQVHARQILLYNSNEAENVYAQLEAGTEFGTLANEYDPLTKGDLGWFPPGYLLVRELDEVTFSLEPGEYSGIIKTMLGYHIVQVLERAPNRLLTADARRVLQLQALEDWLEARREQSEIEILLP